MVEPMSRYTVSYERDASSGWWVAQVKEVPAAITQGRTIAAARRRIREAQQGNPVDALQQVSFGDSDARSG
jgi:predicted RNase H-like HicB family nuclease